MFFIAPTSKIIGNTIIVWGLTIHSKCIIENRNNSKLIIKSGTKINVDSRITNSNEVIVGWNILLGQNVNVTDSTYNCEDIKY